MNELGCSSLGLFVNTTCKFARKSYFEEESRRFELQIGKLDVRKEFLQLSIQNEVVHPKQVK